MVNVQEKQAERILKAFANRRRIAILLYLKKTKEASVGDIAGKITLSIKSTSRHLSTLSGAGIVDHEQRGLQVFYSIAHDMSELARRVIAAL